MRIIVVALLVATTGCSASEVVPPTTGRIHGRVLSPSGEPVAGVLVRVQPPLAPSAVTDADGRYTIERLALGDYDVGIYLTEGTVAAEPNSRPIHVAGDAGPVDFEAVVTPGLGTIRGRVHYDGPGEGRVFIYLITELPHLAPHGTSRMGPGEFEIRGVRPGHYELTAFMDVSGATELHARSPKQYGRPIQVNAGAVTTADVELTDPKPFALEVPEKLEVLPITNGASVQYLVSRHDGHEAARNYKLYWGATPDIGPGSPNNAGVRDDIWPWPGGQPAIYVLYDLVDGEQWYFRIAARGEGDEEGPLSDAYGPVTVGEPKHGNCIRGEITFGEGYEPAGPLVISVESPRFEEPFMQYWAMVENPDRVQPYEICAIQDGPYMLIVRVDSDRDGIFWEHDPSKEYFDGIEAPFLQLRGESLEASATFSPEPSMARVNTRLIEKVGGALSFDVQADIRQIANLPVHVTLTNPSGDVMDLHTGRFPERDGLLAHLETDYGPHRPPTEPWVYDVEYLGGLTERLAVSPRFIETVPTPVAPVGAASGSPLRFEWEAPEPEPNFEHVYFVTVYRDDELYWASPAYGPERRSAEYGEDGARELVDTEEIQLLRPLTAGTYRWELTIRSREGDQAGREAEFAYSP